MRLLKEDYISILNFYNIKNNEHKSKKTLKNIVENKLAQKLCSCINKVPNKGHPKSRAVGICKYSVINRKNINIYNFTCKKNQN